MKEWRLKAAAVNAAETTRQRDNGDISPNVKITNRGRREKIAYSEWSKAPSRLFLALMERAGKQVAA